MSGESRVRVPGDEWTTYRRADGEMIYGDYSFVTELEWFEEDDWPTDLIEETWVLQSTRSFTVNEQPPDEDENETASSQPPATPPALGDETGAVAGAAPVDQEEECDQCWNGAIPTCHCSEPFAECPHAPAPCPACSGTGYLNKGDPS